MDVYRHVYEPCLLSLLSSSRLSYSRNSLRSRGHQFSLPQLNYIRICSLFDVCFTIFSSIIPPHCIVFCLLVVFFQLNVLRSSSSLFLLKMRMSPLFNKGYLT